jgi:hypothetical protein
MIFIQQWLTLKKLWHIKITICIFNINHKKCHSKKNSYENLKKIEKKFPIFW